MVLSFDTAWSDLERVWVQPCLQTAAQIPPTEHRATTQDLVIAYTLCYRMCTQRNPHNWSAELHKRFQEVLQCHVEEQVRPGLEASASNPRALLLEVATRWMQYKAFVQEFQRPFHYLERYYVPANRLPSNAQTGYKAFRDAAWGGDGNRMKTKVQDAILWHAAQLLLTTSGGSSSQEDCAGGSSRWGGQEEEEGGALWCVLGPALSALQEFDGPAAMEMKERMMVMRTTTASSSSSPHLSPLSSSSSPHVPFYDDRHARRGAAAVHLASLSFIPETNVIAINSDPEDKLLRGVLPVAPSQGAFFQRFYCHKLRVLASSPSSPPTTTTRTLLTHQIGGPSSPPASCEDHHHHQQASTGGGQQQPTPLAQPPPTAAATTLSPPPPPPALVEPPPSPTSDGPPTKLSRVGSGFFSSSSFTTTTTAPPPPPPPPSSSPPQARVVVHDSSSSSPYCPLAGAVLMEVVTNLKDDLFRELMDSLYLLPPSSHLHQQPPPAPSSSSSQASAASSSSSAVSGSPHYQWQHQ